MLQILGLLISAVLGVFVGMWVASGESASIHRYAVCHAITEDSVISDCTYQNGAWYRKTDKVG